MDHQAIFGSEHKIEIGYQIRSKKQKYRGMFETQKSGNKTSSGKLISTLEHLQVPKWDKAGVRRSKHSLLATIGVMPEQSRKEK